MNKYVAYIDEMNGKCSLHTYPFNMPLSLSDVRHLILELQEVEVKLARAEELDHAYRLAGAGRAALT